jgi:hypothetical protein
MYHFHGKHVGSLILSRAGNDDQADGLARTATVAHKVRYPQRHGDPSPGGAEVLYLAVRHSKEERHRAIRNASLKPRRVRVDFHFKTKFP